MSKTETMPHDQCYKLLFSQRALVKDLLCGFVHEDWVPRVDFSTLEKVNNEYISNELLKRSNDLVWRLRLADDEWLYVYVLLEFQSRNDHWMALRLMTYVGLLYQDLIKSGQLLQGQRLPPVFPVVIHNGAIPWKAPLELEELVATAPDSLARYSPRMRYFLLDESRQDTQGPAAAGNFVADLIDLECGASPDAVLQVIARLKARLSPAENRTIADAFKVWIEAVLFKRFFSEEDIPHLDTFEEVTTVLAERVDQWREEIQAKALQQGLERGIERGRLEGEVRLLTKLLERRFGPLSEAQRAQLDAADEATLEAWTEQVLTVQSLDELFPSR